MMFRRLFKNVLPLFGLIPFTFSLGAMEEVSNFGENPGNLRMHIHIPKNLEGISPVVVALHGCSQDANELAEQSGWNVLADRYNFIVVYPEQRRVNNVSNCFNWFQLKDIEGENGELASIRNMIAYVAMNNQIDFESIYTYGLSAGAAMANSLLANDPSYFAAGAIFAGGPHKSATNALQGMRVMMNPKNLSPEEWGSFINVEDHENFPRVILVHGTKDNVVDIQNSEELIDQWSSVHGIDTNPDSINDAFAGNEFISRYTFHTEDNWEAIIYYQLHGVGHKLVVNPGEGDKEGGQTGMYAMDLDFFSTYYVAVDFGLIPQD